jgi:hypothetical protein
MNLIGIRVVHKSKIFSVKSLGEGVISSFDGKYITILFDCGETKNFDLETVVKTGIVKAIDAEDQNSIVDKINEMKKSEEDRKRLEREQKAAEAAKKAAEEEAKRAEVSKKTGHKPKPVTKSVRVDGERMVFWVFQGNTFDREFKNGYIWAPIYDQAGNEPHHWKRLLDVRQGDIILHGCDGMLKAISVAKDKCFDCIQPKELESEKLWGADGRMVECDYETIEDPIKTSDYKSDIVRLCTGLYAPFDKNGDGNMGYLYEINSDLVKIFVSETIKKNPRLAAIAHITSLI